ncbi:MAG TPA: nitroreductase family deazaflavin-dependent oxidoreductase [Candidatus Stackebrandtia excrementipullorum]|nr:nitroreductase family deazaflavin-dependent oxidoreductase [Candidatus Stackebrandtia excrementipullorum]
MSDFNSRVIAEFRANDGHVREAANFGNQLVLLHTVGARSGRDRVNPVMAIRDRRGWLVAASAGGAARDPAWAHNLRAHPNIEIESASGEGVTTTAVTARELDGAEYDDAWERFTHRSPMFDRYAERTAGTRTIPVFVLTPRND